MPLPKPNKGESKDDFLSRCMGDDAMQSEYPDEDERYAVCNSQWENKSAASIERRTYDLDNLEIVTREDEPEKIVGHAAVFNSISGNGWFREQVAPGAFKESIKNDDIRALFNHDKNYVLGRNKSGTLELREDKQGLLTTIVPPESGIVRDLVLDPIRRKDITGMSIGFEIITEERTKGEGNEPDLFTIKEAKLWDVSPVTFPFYEQTDVSLRSRETWRQEQRQRPNITGKRLQLLKREFDLRRI